MPAETTEPAPVVAETRPHAAFFRQSGWLMIANVGSGVMMYAVHLLNKKIPPEQYGIFGVLLAVAMFVPSMPLQMVLAQQTAQALATDRKRELAGMIRLAWLGTFGLCLLLALGTFIWQRDILAGWQITNPADLWITVFVVLFSFWLPMFWGVLQGQQNFLWFGWTYIFNGIGRLGIASFLVLALGAYAGGMMLGVCLGLAVGVGVAIWQTRSLWLLHAQPFDWRGLLKQIVPLMLGFAAVQFFFTADTMFVKAYFSGDDAAFYVSAGTLSRGAHVAGGAAGHGDVSENCPQRGAVGKKQPAGRGAARHGGSGGGRRGGVDDSGTVGGQARLLETICLRRGGGAAVVRVGDGAVVTGLCAGQQPDGAFAISRRAGAGAARRGLRYCADPVSRQPDHGAEDARRFQSAAAGRVRFIHVGHKRKSGDGE